MAIVWVWVPVIVVILNIPFGYWRANVKRFSKQWFLSVHIPVPFVVFLRIYARLGWHWTTYPLLVGAYFIGQLLGARFHKQLGRSIRISSCLVCDLWHHASIASR
ncbi:MAG: hypothetical protein ACYCVD_03860 [Desulfitobacteriaceae bacterium]